MFRKKYFFSPSMERSPEGAKSFSVTVYDPDAPTGSGWWHCVIFNIPANVTELKENACNPEANLAPEGSIQSMIDFGKPGFGEACPPQGHGNHCYIFTVHALKTDKLPLDKNAPTAMVGFYLWANIIEKTSLTVNYSR
jgi:Raf kinase inhibitor-like YbhB/YbcL family protein